MSTAAEPAVAPQTFPAQPDTPFVRFPPFPDPPPGVTIIPFKDYKEVGIQLFANGDTEVDGLGIPTLELNIKHDTDTCKTNARRQKKQEQLERELARKRAPNTRREWWEQWAEAEDLRLTSVAYNPNMLRVDRLYQAANDFRVGRSWPPQSAGVHALWDQFRLFTGLLSATPIWQKTDAKDGSPDPGDFDDEDEDEDGPGNIAVGQKSHDPTQKTYPPRPRPRPPYETYGKEPVRVTSDEEIQELLQEEKAHKEDKLIDFLNDPERSIKIFLSSYIRKQGLVWSDRNLVAIPHLICFFLNFLLRNRVLPETERGLRAALAVAELSKKELPLTSKLAKELPDDLNAAFTECWGHKADGYKTLQPEHIAAHIEPAEPDPPAADPFEAELKAANVEVLSAADVALATPADAGGWGSGGWATSTWGGANGDAGGGDDPWAIPPANWDPPVRHALLTWLGPTALPLTHAPGVVECALRRITAVLPPAPRPGPAGDAAGGVEAELAARCARVLLAPWLAWDTADERELAQPRILATSRGPVADAAGGAGHCPTADEIAVLMLPRTAALLQPGMGLGATWVQIAREERLREYGDGDGGDDEPAKKKRRKGKGRTGETLWYMEELMMVFPSYYMV